MNRPASGWLMLAAVSLVFVGLDQINSVASLFNTQTAAFRRAEYALFLGSTLIAVVFFTRRRWIPAILWFVSGAVLVFYLHPIAWYVNSLGPDSFTELQNFDWNEAKFYLATLQAYMQPALGRRMVALYLASTLAVVVAVYVLCKAYRLTSRSFRRVHAIAGMTLVGCSLIWIVAHELKPFRFFWQTHQQIVENFRQPPFALEIANPGLKLVIYIGESTTSLHMGLYGYPRDTTPGLMELKRRHKSLFVFENVLSTHVHTTPSLLEALSVPVDRSEDFLDVYSRRRISLIPILKANGVATHLISNQGGAGFWDLASSVIFGEADSRKHSAHRVHKDASSRDRLKFERPFDHAFLLPNFEAVLSETRAKQGGIIFLHAYAGHGPYLNYTPPEFRQPVDNYLRHTSGAPLLDARLTEEVDAYDSTVRYTDSVVSSAIEAVAQVEEPVVFIYFADHGESVYARRGHDAALYVHEMLRVPFVMFFNDAAVAAHPALVSKYAALSARGNVATLAQLPSTIVDLLGVDIRSQPVARYFSEPIGENIDGRLAPVFVRKLGDEVRYVALDRARRSDEVPEKTVEATDDTTRIFVATRSPPDERPKICSRTFEKLGEALLGSFVADCLQVDAAADANGEFAAKSTAAGTSIPLQRFEAIAQRRNLVLWMSAETLRSGPGCWRLEKQLTQDGPARTRILLEFAAPAEFDDESWLDCLRTLRKKGFLVALRLDAVAVQKCAIYFDPARECMPLLNTIRAAHSRGFDRFTFDYSGSLDLLTRLDPNNAFRWIARRVDLNALKNMSLDGLEMVMTDTSLIGN